jgi:WD40 repeat protein
MRGPTDHKYELIIKNDETRNIICSDHSLYQWDTRESPRFGKTASHMYHVGPIWAIDQSTSSGAPLPVGTIVTGGADETIRFWRLNTAGERDGGGQGKTYDGVVNVALPFNSVFQNNLLSLETLMSKNEDCLESFSPIKIIHKNAKIF